MSNMSLSTENGNLTETTIPYIGVLEVVVGEEQFDEHSATRDYTTKFYKEFAGLVKEYGFCKFVSWKDQEKFFKSFGPNWAYHMVNTIKTLSPDNYSRHVTKTECSSCSGGECDPEYHCGEIASLLSRNADNLCEGNFALDDDTMSTLYCWRPDIKVSHRMKRSGDTLDQATGYVYNRDLTVFKTFEDRVSRWKTRVEEMIKGPYFGKIECPNCSGPPERPLRLTRSTPSPSSESSGPSPLSNWHNSEVYPVPSPCCSNGRIAFINF